MHRLPLWIVLAAGCDDRSGPVPLVPGPPVGRDPIPMTRPDISSCLDASDAETWTVELEWAFSQSGRMFTRTPVVANLDDDEVPDVIAVNGGYVGHSTIFEGNVLVIAGDTGRVQSRGPFIEAGVGIAVADVDGDGAQEIVVPFRQDGVGDTHALDQNLDDVWVADDGGSTSAPTVADLDNDGRPEVIHDGAIVDGADGSVISRYPGGDLTRYGYTVTTADLDLDGQREVLLGNVVLRADGTRWWSAPEGEMAFPVPVDVDDDPEGEVLMVRTTTLQVYDTDGVHLGSRRIAHSGEPALADLDGDGVLDLVVSGEVDTSALRLDGTPIWTTKHDNVVSAAVAFDFDGDGAYEVVTAESRGFDILDGRTGDSLARVDVNLSTGAYPLVVDVDRDGSAEILVTGSQLSAFGNPLCGWSRGRGGWGLHDFNGQNLGEDGAVPVHEPPIWQTTGHYRAHR